MPLRKVFLFLSVLAAASQGYVGQWRSFANRERVTSLIAHRGFVYAGTQGGIRKIDPGTYSASDFNNLDGLLDCWITGLAESGDGTLWAVSRSGYVYAFTGSRWDAYGRSYAAGHWLMNERAVLGAGRTLFLGSEKGLALFDVTQRISQANLVRFADQIDLSVLSLLPRGDTLYIGTPKGVYKAQVDFNDPINPRPGYGNIFDPSRWIPVVFPQDTVPDSLGMPPPPRQYDALAFIGDSLATYSAGTVLPGPVPVEVLYDSSLRVGSKTFPKDWATYGSALWVGGQLFLGGRVSLAYIQNPGDAEPAFSGIPVGAPFPRDTVMAIAAHGSAIWGQSVSGLYRLDAARQGFEPVVPTPLLYPSIEVFYRQLKNLAADRNGDFYLGTWGSGLFRMGAGGAIKVWNHQSDSCIFEIFPNFPVLQNVSNIHREHLFFTTLTDFGGNSHQLVALNTSTNRISCPQDSVPGLLTHAVRILSDTLVGVASDRGMAFFKVSIGSSGPSLTSLGLVAASGEGNEGWDLAADRWGRPWMLIGNLLGFADSIDHPRRTGPIVLDTAHGFSGRGCRVLKPDPVGSFWIGCENGLFNLEPTLAGMGKVERFGLDEGLLGLPVRDIAVDAVNGYVWVSTDRGISQLESRSQPPVFEISGVRAYPNPFRTGHRFVIFDNLPKNSTLRIHTATGNVLRTFRPSDLTGNQAQWDGKNQDGKSVAPGVYPYSVTAGSSVRRGKIIVAR